MSLPILLMNWFYAHNSDRHGPVDVATLSGLVADGTITAETLVWREGMENWTAYGEIAAAEGLPVPGEAPDDDTAICAVDGKRYPKREMIEYEGRWVSAANRDVFFQQLREGVPLDSEDIVPGPYGYGGVLYRFVALIIDGIAVAVLSMVVTIPMSFLMLSMAQTSPEAALGLQIISQILSYALAITYDIFFIRKYDATPGKMAMGLKVLRADGQKLSKLRIFGRYFAEGLSAIILGIGYLMAAWDDEKRTLHDRLCDTRVIRTRPQ